MTFSNKNILAKDASFETNADFYVHCLQTKSTSKNFNDVLIEAKLKLLLIS